MRKLLLTSAVLLGLKAGAQTLFTYGNDSVSVEEFLYAFQKNNAGKKDARAVQEYLNLYIASRLKVKEARERGYDTVPQLLADLESLKAQIMPAYLNDPQSLNRLVQEAFQRSQKDIHLAHIFISLRNQQDEIDSVTAQKKAAEAYRQLQKGASFATVAKQFSDDPSAAFNGGDMGYITVFTLPYELENLAYTTPVGKISPLHRSAAGYHIFKNEGERKALGRIRAAQILLAVPPGGDAAEKQKIKRLADSIYQRLQKGDDFGTLAAQFSNDPVSANANGTLPEFGVGQYDPLFEKVVFALPKDGAISAPFETAHGFHIVKRLSRIPVITDAGKAAPLLKERVQQSDRAKTLEAELVQAVLKKSGYKPPVDQFSQLKLYTDQALDNKPANTALTLSTATPLFQLGKEQKTVEDWITYARTFRFTDNGSGTKPFEQLWNEFVHTAALEHYKAHLEDYNADFRNQMNEFREGNLFFEIMQREVWGPAQTDTAALQQYYNQHKDAYIWKKSAEAVVFYAGDEAVAKKLLAQLQKAPTRWSEIVSEYSDQVSADSGRFEWSSLPNAAQTPFKKGMFTKPVINKADGTVSFAYILQTHAQPLQRSFEEAKGAVINDYQNELEKRWIEELKKKYPVTIKMPVEQVLR